MKIAITSQGKDLNAEIDPRFGRCGYFIIYDTENDEFEAVDNTNAAMGGGVGPQSAQTISEKGAKAVLTGNVGPNAYQTLQAADITVYAGVSGTVSDAVDKFKNGSLKPYDTHSVQSHFGMGQTPQKTSPQDNKKKIAVAADDDGGINAEVSAHFGRCPYYTIVEVENDSIHLSYKVENPFYQKHGPPGQVPEFIRDQNANVIIAGGMGQRAVGFFDQFGIEAVTGAAGKVQAVVNAYLKGALKGTTPCEH